MNYTADQRAIVNEAKRIQREARKAATKARPKSEKASRGREIDNGFLQYIRRQPCEARHLGNCVGMTQAAHIRYHVHGIANSAGMGVKNHDRHCNPLCGWHHNSDQHKRKEQDFWSDLGKDAYATAAAHYAAYRGEKPAADETGSLGMEARSSRRNETLSPPSPDQGDEA